MKTKSKNQFQRVMFLAIVVALAFSWSSARGDDLNPPSYRGDPLSVYAHWLIDATGALTLDQYLWVDDTDPSTNLFPTPPDVLFDPTSGSYDFRIPNWVDEEPIKFLRIQLTWAGTTQPPISISSVGTDGPNFVPVPGVVTFASTPLVFTQPDGGYQFFDIEYKPNPDFESISVLLPPDASLVQVVVDSVSTIPEPSSVLLLASGLAMLRFRNKKVV